MKSTFHPSLACYNSQRALDSPPASLSLKPKGGILVWTNVVSSSLAWKQTKFGGEKWMANINATPTISCFHAFIRQKNFSIYKIQQKRMVFWCKFKAHTSSDNKLNFFSKNGRESMLDTLIMTYLFWITFWLLMERPSHLGQVQSCLLLKSPGSSPENFISYSKCKSWTDMLE